MPKSHFSPAQSARLRERIAREAARLIMRGKVRGFHTARMRAGRWLSQTKLTSAEIPTQDEIAHELAALATTTDWDQLTRIDWAAAQTLSWLSPCDPWLHEDWQQADSHEGVLFQWLVDQQRLVQVERLLIDRRIEFQTTTQAAGLLTVDFQTELPNRIYVTQIHNEAENQQTWATASDHTLAHMTLRVGNTNIEFQKPNRFQSLSLTEHQPVENDDFYDDQSGDPEQHADEADNWAEFFAPLLRMLEQVDRNDPEHPESNVLFHSLQVYQQGVERHPYDEEFQWACLLHDLGMAIDVRDPNTALLRLLTGRVSQRVLFLVTELPAAHEILCGLPARKSLRKDPSFDELLDLARCDRSGRIPGTPVCTLDQALSQIGRIGSQWDDA